MVSRKTYKKKHGLIRKRTQTSTKKRVQRRKTQKKTYKTQKRMYRVLRGGSYEKDVTTRTLENVPVKPLNKVVVTVPGRGIMSASSYIKLMDDLDINGDQYYD